MMWVAITDDDGTWFLDLGRVVSIAVPPPVTEDAALSAVASLDAGGHAFLRDGFVTRSSAEAWTAQLVRVLDGDPYGTFPEGLTRAADWGRVDV